MRKELLTCLAALILLFAAHNVGLSQQEAPRGPLKKTPNHSAVPFDLKQTIRAVVSIRTFDKAGKPLAEGTGFFLDSDGCLVTNYHVIAKAASAVVKSYDGGFHQVEGIRSMNKTNDLALLKVEGRDLPTLSLADSNLVSPGDRVFAIGNPLGLEATLSEGIVSSVRELEGVSIIQTTAPISPGSSGGALLNVDGKVVGVTAFHIEGGQNLNFAIPSNYVKPLLSSNTVTPFQPVEPEPVADSPEALPVPRPTQDVTPFPSAWVDVSGGSPLTIRVLGDYIYTEGQFEDHGEEVWNYITGGHFRCEIKKEGFDWLGKCWLRLNMGMAYQIYSGVPATCDVTLPLKITLFSRQRIEGQTGKLLPGAQKGSCPIGFQSTTMDFAWIPSK
ncbi:MAG: S1C family serine protease [Candidatus Acidiferrales bacterium]